MRVGGAVCGMWGNCDTLQGGDSVATGDVGVSGFAKIRHELPNLRGGAVNTGVSRWKLVQDHGTTLFKNSAR